MTADIKCRVSMCASLLVGKQVTVHARSESLHDKPDRLLMRL